MNKYISKYRKEQEQKLRNLQSKTPKEYWRYLNSLHKNKNTDMPQAECFLNYYKNIDIENADDHDKTFSDDFSLNDDNEILNSERTENKILKCIRSLKNGKAAGNDQVINEYIKVTAHLFMPSYLKLFNNILNTGFIPDDWLKGIVKSIFKNKGDHLKPENYRLITILSCTGKLFTSVLNIRLTTFLDTHDILNENQAGFRKEYSTVDHILS